MITMTIPQLEEPGSHRGDAWKAIGVGMLVAAVVFIGVVGFLTLLGVSSAQQNHFQTVKSIDSIATNLAKGNKGVSEIFTAAGMAVIALEQSQARIEHNEYAACIAVKAPSCIPPTS